MPGSLFLGGDRLTLRSVDRDDAAFVERWHNDPRIRVPLGVRQPRNRKQTEDDFENWVESDSGVTLLVCVGDDGEDGEDDGDNTEAIGLVSVKNVQYTRPELSYWLIPEYRGEGYATEAMELLLDYTFETFEINDLWAQAFEYNEASWRLLEALGFSREGTMRGHRFVRGEHEDVVVYGLLREEWRA